MAAANYCLRGDLSDEMQVTDPTEDARIDRAITDASRTVDAFCRQEPGTFAPQTKTKIFDVSPVTISSTLTHTWRGLGSFSYMGSTTSLYVPPLLSVTSLSTSSALDGVYDTVWTPNTDYLLWPRNHEVKRRIDTNQSTGKRGFLQGEERVQVVGSWGITEEGQTPLPIRRATLLLAMIYYRRPSNAPNSQGLGGAAVRIGYIDMDVAAICLGVGAGKYKEHIYGC